MHDQYSDGKYLDLAQLLCLVCLLYLDLSAGHCKARVQYRGLLCLALHSTCATDSVGDNVLRTFAVLHNNITFEIIK